MEFVAEKKEVVERHVKVENYLIVPEDDLKRLFDELKKEAQQYRNYMDDLDYKKFKEMVENENVYVKVLLGTTSYEKWFVLRVKGDEQ